MKSHLPPQVGLLAKPQAQVQSLKTTHFQRQGGEVKGVCRDTRWAARGDRGEPVLTHRSREPGCSPDCPQ